MVLYKVDSCPYCRSVMRRAEDLGIELSMRDVREEQGARRELMGIGGKGQVPCLVIDGDPLYESADIIAYLERITN